MKRELNGVSKTAPGGPAINSDLVSTGTKRTAQI